MNDTVLYVVRHGKSLGNARRIWQGKCDFPLIDEGRAQARSLGEKLRDIPFSVCYASPLSRALETARIILMGRDIPIVTDARLAEFDAGIWCGNTIDWIAENDPENLKCWRETPELCAFPGGETVAAAYERSNAAMDEYALRHPGEKVLVATHAGMLRCMTARFRYGGIRGMREPFPVPNCSVSVFRRDGEGVWHADEQEEGRGNRE